MSRPSRPASVMTGRNGMLPFTRESRPPAWHDLLGHRRQGVEIGVIRRVLAELVLHPERHVVLGPRQHRRDPGGRVGAGRGSRRPAEPHDAAELCHRRPQPACLVGREHPGQPPRPAVGVVEQLQDRRFVDDDGAHQLGPPGDQVERDDRARAGAEHSGRPAAVAGDQRRRVVDVGGDPVRVVNRTVDRAVGEPAPRVSDHGEVPGQPVRDAGEYGRVAVAAHHEQQQRTDAAGHGVQLR